MSQHVAPRPVVTPRDRLTLTLVLAAALHAIVILGLGFGGFFSSEQKRDDYPSFEITLVNTRTDNAPDDAAYLAQANQEGGGNTKEKVRAETIAPALVARETPARTSPTPPAEITPQHRENRREVLTSPSAENRMSAALHPAQKNAEENVTASQLISRSMQIASLEMELGRSVQAYAKQPRSHFITASSREAKDVAYMDAWRKKVERVGNLNYPDEALRRNLSGNLILDVALNPDGTVRDIAVSRSSGHTVLDEAAVRIVHLAAPYAPFPEGMRKEYDVFHIIRTWRFETGEGMKTD